ncbi:MAG: hypothetical protein LBU44_09870 [Mediterranea sp.]|jgi:hypothetical protein|nr:hypothetical protein [Mediterranea sp.]
MLDATDGKTVAATIGATRRLHARRVKTQVVGIDTCENTVPRVTVRTRGGECAGSINTVAHSRIGSNHSS